MKKKNSDGQVGGGNRECDPGSRTFAAGRIRWRSKGQGEAAGLPQGNMPCHSASAHIVAGATGTKDRSHARYGLAGGNRPVARRPQIGGLDSGETNLQFTPELSCAMKREGRDQKENKGSAAVV